MAGESPNVKGMKTAMVIVAVKPGSAPNTIPISTPKKDDRYMTGLVKKCNPER